MPACPADPSRTGSAGHRRFCMACACPPMLCKPKPLWQVCSQRMCMGGFVSRRGIVLCAWVQWNALGGAENVNSMAHRDSNDIDDQARHGSHAVSGSYTVRFVPCSASLAPDCIVAGVSENVIASGGCTTHQPRLLMLLHCTAPHCMHCTALYRMHLQVDPLGFLVLQAQVAPHPQAHPTPLWVALCQCVSPYFLCLCLRGCHKTMHATTATTRYHHWSSLTLHGIVNTDMRHVQASLIFISHHLHSCIYLLACKKINTGMQPEGGMAGPRPPGLALPGGLPAPPLQMTNGGPRPMMPAPPGPAGASAIVILRDGETKNVFLKPKCPIPHSQLAVRNFAVQKWWGLDTRRVSYASWMLPSLSN